MAKPLIFSDDHLQLIRKLYLRQHRPPREVAAMVNSKFGSSFSVRQISSMLTERGWAGRRREAKSAAILAVNDRQDQIAAAGRADVDRGVADEVVSGQLRIGQKIMRRAEIYVDTASSGKSLSSAASAARSGVALARGALGLDLPGAAHGLVNFNFNFASQAAPLFAKKRAEIVSSQPIDAHSD